MFLTINNFRLAFVAASLLAVTVLCSQATALPVGTAYFQKAQMKAAKQASSNQLSEAVHVLNSVEHTLQHADHDYGGHRVEAIHAIKAAKHQLKLIYEHHHKHHHAATGTKPKNQGQGAGGAEPEPQKLSDAQLKQAIPVLNTTAGFISQANHDFGGHRTKAIKDIQHAVAQLHVALKYSAVKNVNKP